MKNDSEEIKSICLDSEKILKNNFAIVDEKKFIENTLFDKYEYYIADSKII
jgi:hypothetical protein